jgi:uncharacterized membrane protein YecN with MAPEG domain
MPVAITALYTAILSLVVLALAVNVSMHRGKLKVDIGDGDNPQMLRMIRIHGNAIEYVPIALLLMAVYELDGGSHRILHIAGIALIVGRLGNVEQAGADFRTDRRSELDFANNHRPGNSQFVAGRVSNCAVRMETRGRRANRRPHGIAQGRFPR